MVGHMGKQENIISWTETTGDSSCFVTYINYAQLVSIINIFCAFLLRHYNNVMAIAKYDVWAFAFIINGGMFITKLLFADWKWMKKVKQSYFILTRLVSFDILILCLFFKPFKFQIFNFIEAQLWISTSIFRGLVFSRNESTYFIGLVLFWQLFELIFGSICLPKL